MARSAMGLIGLIVFLIIVIGAGILIYRFVRNDDSTAKVITINDQGKFANSEYTIGNDEVLRIQNNSDKNQTVKKSSDQSTLVEVDGKSSSRELALSDNSETELFLAGDTSQKTKVKVGTPPTQTTEQTPPAREESGTTAGTSTTSLPDTGPENNLIFIGFALVGFALARFSRRLLN